MYKVQISNSGGTIFDVVTKDYKFTVDTKGEGVTPTDAFLAGLGSCVGVYLRRYCENTTTGIEEFEITVEGELSKEKPSSFRTINIGVDLKGVAIDDMRRKSILQFIKNCPVHNTLKINPEIIVEIK